VVVGGDRRDLGVSHGPPSGRTRRSSNVAGAPLGAIVGPRREGEDERIFALELAQPAQCAGVIRQFRSREKRLRAPMSDALAGLLRLGSTWVSLTMVTTPFLPVRFSSLTQGLEKWYCPGCQFDTGREYSCMPLSKRAFCGIYRNLWSSSAMRQRSAWPLLSRASGSLRGSRSGVRPHGPDHGVCQSGHISGCHLNPAVSGD